MFPKSRHVQKTLEPRVGSKEKEGIAMAMACIVVYLMITTAYIERGKLLPKVIGA